MKARTTLGCFAVVLILLTLATISASILSANARARSDATLAKLREQGYPTTPVELDKWYAKPAEAENGATSLVEAIRLHKLPPPSMDENAPTIFTLQGDPELPAPEAALTDVERSLMAAYLTENAEPIRLVRESMGHDTSRFPTDLTRGMATELPHLSELRRLSSLFEVKATSDAAAGKTDDAVESVLAAFHVGESLAEEPVLISQLVRIACHSIAQSALGQVLGRTELSQPQLTRIEDAIGTIEARDTFYRGFVGEFVNGLGAFDGGFPIQGTFGESQSVAQSTATLYTWTFGRGDRAWYVSQMIRIIDASRLPVEERLTRSKEIEREIEAGISWTRALSSILLPALSRGVDAGVRDHAGLRCARVAVAIEQFRLANGGSLPESLDTLMPQYLDAVPLDPYNRQPLLYKRLDPGYAVYSVGENLTDDGAEPEEEGRRGSRAEDVAIRVAR